MHWFRTRDEMRVAIVRVRHFEVEVAATSRFHDRTVSRRDYRSRENRKLLILLRTAAETRPGIQRNEQRFLHVAQIGRDLGRCR
jgi:hypothetical protein